MFTKMKTLQKIVDTVLPQSEVVFRCKSAVTQIDVDHAGFAALSCEVLLRLLSSTTPSWIFRVYIHYLDISAADTAQP